MTDMSWTDTNGDTVGDIGQADTNGNGIADSFQMDLDFNGYAETAAQDTDENGVIDNLQIDTDNNGTLDTATVDVDQNGVADYVATPNTGGQFVSLAPAPNPGLGNPAIIGGGGHDPLIDLIPYATPGQVDQITDMLDSKNDAIKVWLQDDDDDDD